MYETKNPQIVEFVRDEAIFEDKPTPNPLDVLAIHDKVTVSIENEIIKKLVKRTYVIRGTPLVEIEHEKSFE
jgi:hypothetical protein